MCVLLLLILAGLLLVIFVPEGFANPRKDKARCKKIEDMLKPPKN
jgi:hypothetical protein